METIYPYAKEYLSLQRHARFFIRACAHLLVILVYILSLVHKIEICGRTRARRCL